MDSVERLARCDRLVRAGHLDKAEPELKPLLEITEVAKQAQKLLAVCRQLRRVGIVSSLQPYAGKHLELSAAREDPDFGSEASILISRKVNESGTVLVFTGNARQFWISIHLLHRFLSSYDCNIVYLKDCSKRAYLRGIPEFGTDQKSLILGISDLVADLGCLHLYSLGSSTGGYTALRVGVELNAVSSLAFSPATCQGGFALPLNGAGVEAPDLRDLYLSSPSPPYTTLVFAEHHQKDSQSCERMAGLPTVTLVPVRDYDGHDVIAQTIATGLFPVLIDRLLPDVAGARQRVDTQRDLLGVGV